MGSWSNQRDQREAARRQTRTRVLRRFGMLGVGRSGIARIGSASRRVVRECWVEPARNMTPN
eukprot:9187628-Alexandrium_andersonii.AAC.1